MGSPLLPTPITSLDLPELAPYRTMRMQHEHYVQRMFVAEGEKVVRRLLASPLEVLSVLLPEDWLDPLRSQLESRLDSPCIYTAPKALLERLTGYSMYQGLLALGRIPPPLTVDTVLHQSPRPRFYAAVDGLANAENLGALVRNAVAFQTQALLVGETSSSPYLRRAVRSSMGAVFELPVVETSDLVGALRHLRRHGVHCVAAHPHTDRRIVSQANFTGDCCLVFGSEGHGLNPLVLAACDDAVAIPMPPRVDSLNVASAAAVFLYEAQRQRQFSRPCNPHLPRSNPVPST